VRKELNRCPYPGFRDAAADVAVAAADDDEDDARYVYGHSIYSVTQVYELRSEVGFVLLRLAYGDKV